jgi:hypothetical protein
MEITGRELSEHIPRTLRIASQEIFEAPHDSVTATDVVRGTGTAVNQLASNSFE